MGFPTFSKRPLFSVQFKKINCTFFMGYCENTEFLFHSSSISFWHRRYAPLPQLCYYIAMVVWKCVEVCSKILYHVIGLYTIIERMTCPNGGFRTPSSSSYTTASMRPEPQFSSERNRER